MVRKISCSILTPEKILFEGDIAFAVVQAHNGELGFLYNHAPIVSELGIGEIRLRDEHSTEYLYIEGGIVEVRDNRMIVLAENALRKADLDKNQLEKNLKELKERDFKAFSPEKMLLQIEERKIKARLKVVNR